MLDDTAKGERRIEGDLPPFEEIFRLHHRRVYAMCLRMAAFVATKGTLSTAY